MAEHHDRLPHWLVSAACKGKQAMQPAIARQIAKRMRRSKHENGISAYRCPACGHWHVGNNPRRVN